MERYVILSRQVQKLHDRTDQRLFCELAVLAPGISKRFNKPIGKQRWASAQISGSLRTIGGSGIPIGWWIGSESEIDAADREIAAILESVGLPFLDRFQSERDVLDAMHQGKHVLMSVDRAQWEAAIVDGLIPSDTPPPKSHESGFVGTLEEFFVSDGCRRLREEVEEPPDR